VLVGSGSEERRDKGLNGRRAWLVVIPPYDDARIIAGQGTAGLEILKIFRVELVLVPVGGGGLSSGVAAAVKLSGSRAKVMGVEPALANDAQQSLREGSCGADCRRERGQHDGRWIAHPEHRDREL